MINEENKTEVIDQYLAGALTGDQLNEVKNRIETDPKFRHEVAFQEKIIQTVRQLEHEQLKSRFESIYKEDDGLTDKVVPFYQRPLYYYAAAITFLVIAGLFWLLNKRSPTETYRGFLAVEVESTRGADKVLDSIPLTIIDHPEYDFHYQWGDTLTLYGPFVSEEISVRFENDTYILQVRNQPYTIKQDNTIHLLRP